MVNSKPRGPEKFSLERLRHFLNSVANIQQANDRARLVTGNAFTTFAEKRTPGAKGIKIDELLASSVLAALLDPNGNHGQGDYFLKKFLDCSRISFTAKWQLERCRSILEQGIQGSLAIWENKAEAQKRGYRRIDLMLEFREALIGIEVKLDADDRENQLTDYMNELVARSRGREFFLVYLTLDGKKPDMHTWKPNKLRDAAAEHRLRLCSWRDLASCFPASPDELPLKVFFFVNDFFKAIRSQFSRRKKCQITAQLQIFWKAQM